ncbi:ATP-binding protein [Streptantibioticus cattleyicolor]|uniref:histidine kinase n=1 Tax=Streptantibioticus cattleyicolor (strain ATCC 35852 / DSM 46488 / JCM 4925 / NBRC 14057 / NRRL 8057) TaxID=1003195 RepID=F8JM17_STREN|nr:ATP-binding protein [Streptantibioticus cattleyicolor]AEW99459.1 putative sensor-like histidine kinase [Streptantibioticus cattleyicolor NRRL 8057 = DSM 46488]CCB71499.1 putative sensor-like histidine kinase [Streptantibioticus cattleyicolor NRRL 8057 = DSM 46488]
MTSLVKDPFFWALLFVLLVVAVAFPRSRRINLRLRRGNAELEEERQRLQRRHDELDAVVSRMREQHAVALTEVRNDAEEDTKAVLKAAMRTLQVLADEQQVVIDKVQKKYGDDPQILADLMMVDHTNSQFGRRAQGIAVLCGGWLGRREEVASIYDVARSAQGRIRHFDRVRIHAQLSVSVASKAVEPVAVVLAELLANATNYSAPGAPVEINIQSVPKGVCLIVDDAGLGMSQEEKERASELLRPRSPISITSLGNPPKFGFAVCGMLAARYGFSVSVDSVSPYGGVRAVVLLPSELLTNDVAPPPPVEVPAAEGSEPEPAPQRLAPVADAAPAPERAGTTAGGLPKRRRKSPVSVVPQPQSVSAGPIRLGEPPRGVEDTPSRLGAFQRGTLSGRDMSAEEGSELQ